MMLNAGPLTEKELGMLKPEPINCHRISKVTNRPSNMLTVLRLPEKPKRKKIDSQRKLRKLTLNWSQTWPENFKISKTKKETSPELKMTFKDKKISKMVKLKVMQIMMPHKLKSILWKVLWKHTKVI
jgi:hypothetical protein